MSADFIHLLELCVMCAVVAFIFCYRLIAAGNILSSPYAWLRARLTKRIETNIEPPEEVKALPDYDPKKFMRIELKEHWLLKVVGGCVFCTAGQFALWCFVIRFILMPYLPHDAAIFLIVLGRLIFTICCTILIIYILKPLLKNG